MVNLTHVSQNVFIKQVVWFPKNLHFRVYNIYWRTSSPSFSRRKIFLQTSPPSFLHFSMLFWSLILLHLNQLAAIPFSHVGNEYFSIAVSTFCISLHFYYFAFSNSGSVPGYRARRGMFPFLVFRLKNLLSEHGTVCVLAPETWEYLTSPLSRTLRITIWKIILPAGSFMNDSEFQSIMKTKEIKDFFLELKDFHSRIYNYLFWLLPKQWPLLITSDLIWKYKPNYGCVFSLRSRKVKSARLVLMALIMVLWRKCVRPTIGTWNVKAWVFNGSSTMA